MHGTGGGAVVWQIRGVAKSINRTPVPNMYGSCSVMSAQLPSKWNLEPNLGSWAWRLTIGALFSNSCFTLELILLTCMEQAAVPCQAESDGTGGAFHLQRHQSDPSA